MFGKIGSETLLNIDAITHIDPIKEEGKKGSYIFLNSGEKIHSELTPDEILVIIEAIKPVPR
ncbi:hypothetical protein ACFL35_01900 [Candidatus Riflebacteria bacterium]